MHLDALVPLTLALFAPAALDVEAEPPRFVSANLRFARLAEDFPDFVEDAGVGRGVGPRRAADGALIDLDHLVDLADSINRLMHTRLDL